jgi:hypothetical protein
VTRAAYLLLAATALSSCASQSFHPGPTSLSSREQRALKASARARADGFERFWLRPGCELGLLKWAPSGSQTAPSTPPGTLDLIRDEVGRLNQQDRRGEEVFVTVVVFAWRERWFGRSPEVSVEVVGRDVKGQVLWLGEDTLVVQRSSARDLAESDPLLLARAVGQKLRRELGL